MTDTRPHYHLLLASGLVSKPYASQIARGVRIPPLKLALRIHAATGLKYGLLVNMSGEQIAGMACAVEQSA